MSMPEIQVAPKSVGGIRDYLRMARLDHVTKHVFMVPGVILALLLRGSEDSSLPILLSLGFAAAVAIASANYVLNEWLDRDFDAYHPEKSRRVAVQTELDVRMVFAFYFGLAALGLALAMQVNRTFFVVILSFLLAGVAYNVPPVRTKDRPYIDVLSESINNPLRMMLGWAMVDGTSLPPVSVLLAFWFGGAFLMNAKRLAEYRDIVAETGLARLSLYRRSFGYYTETRLSTANLAYALLSAFFLAVFIAKYRIEYILLVPVVTYLFVVYYHLSLQPNSVARKPELLFRQPCIVGAVFVLSVAFLGTTLVDLPVLERLSAQHFIDISGRVVPPRTP